MISVKMCALAQTFELSLKNFECASDDELGFAKNARLESFVETMQKRGFERVIWGQDMQYLRMTRSKDV